MFTPTEYAGLALLRRAIEAGAYDDDRVPADAALDGGAGDVARAAGQDRGSAAFPRRRKPKVDRDIVIACFNGAAILAAIAAAALGSGLV